MTYPRFVLLPGLDGTARLFDRFLAAAPAHCVVTPVALPAEPLNYEELAIRVADMLRDFERVVLIAESFSGPLAIALATQRPVNAIVFSNSFVSAPRLRVLRKVVTPAMFQISPPAILLRRYMVGPAAEDALVRELSETITAVAPSLLASRLRTVLDTDMSAAFANCSVPVLYLRGTGDRLVSESSFRHMESLRPMSVARVPGPHLLLHANPVGA